MDCIASGGIGKEITAVAQKIPRIDHTTSGSSNGNECGSTQTWSYQNESQKSRLSEVHLIERW